MLELSVSAAAPRSAMSAVALSTAVTLVAVTLVALAERPVSRSKIRSPEIVAAVAPSTAMPTEDGGDGPAITLLSIRGVPANASIPCQKPEKSLASDRRRAAEARPDLDRHLGAGPVVDEGVVIDHRGAGAGAEQHVWVTVGDVGTGERVEQDPPRPVDDDRVAGRRS